jgi:hypothetical protein
MIHFTINTRLTQLALLAAAAVSIAAINGRFAW